MRKFLSWILVSALLLGVLPVSVFAAEKHEMDFTAIVEQQVRKFAATLGQKDSVDNAASALAKHGISGKGKTLKAGQSHALTATLWSSELLQRVVTDCCANGIRNLQQADIISLPNAYGTIGWYEAKRSYCVYTQIAAGVDEEKWDWELFREHGYTGKVNDYDQALYWIAGSTVIALQVERTKVTQTESTYRVTCTISDRFDFDSIQSSGFKGLVSGLAALMFRSFDWESTASFDLTVPYSCTHSSGAYHWTYDPDTAMISSDAGGNFLENPVTRHTYITDDGLTGYYHELEETVRLYHDKPWVLEYDIQNPHQVSFAPFGTTLSVTRPALTVQAKTLYFRFMYYYMEGDILRTAQNMFGMRLSEPLTIDEGPVCTYRLENRIAADGSNCIYLTVTERDTGRILVDDEPMDNRYRRELTTGLVTLKSESDNGMNGEDLYVNFIGYQGCRFLAGQFDLRIWENGQDQENGTYFSNWQTLKTSTCATPGEETRHCVVCGLQETRVIPALGHTPGEEATCIENQTCTVCNAVLTAAKGHAETEIPAGEATCEKEGSTAGKKCAVCNEVLLPANEIPALGHSYYAGICTLCGAADPDFLPGDANGDGKVDYNDALLILRASIGLETLSEEIILTCDWNQNGKPDYTDALRILRTSIGL